MTGSTSIPPRVSIVIPTYNGGQFLRECLASVQAQTLGDFEVVIVDDDSDDDTLAIATEFAARDARFRVQRNPRQLGLVGNWNRCLELSRGTWIKLLFQDDTIAPDCLQELVAACERHQCAFGFCSRDFLFDAQVTARNRDYFLRHQARVETSFGAHTDAETFSKFCAAHPETNPVGEPTVTIFRRSLLKQCGRFNVALIQMCDSEYWLRLGSRVGVTYVPRRLATFRVHAGSATAQNHAQRTFRTEVLDPLIIQYLILRSPKHRGLRRALCQQVGAVRAWWWLIYNAAAARKTALAGGVELAEWRNVARLLPGLRTLALAGAVLVPVQSRFRKPSGKK